MRCRNPRKNLASNREADCIKAQIFGVSPIFRGTLGGLKVGTTLPGYLRDSALAQSQALSRHQPHEQAQPRQQGYKVGGGYTAGL